MNTRRCYKLADRIDAGLKQELGQGIDREHMVHRPLYARDVLLVCDALRGTELAALAQKFRSATAAADPAAELARAAAATGEPSGFSPSRFFSSLFGPAPAGEGSHGEATPPPPARRGGWFGRSGSTRK